MPGELKAGGWRLKAREAESKRKSKRS